MPTVLCNYTLCGEVGCGDELRPNQLLLGLTALQVPLKSVGKLLFDRVCVR